MKVAPILLLGACLSFITACDRKPRAEVLEAERRRAEQLQQMDDRIAQLQDAERRATERDAANATRERDRIAAEKAELERERDDLARQQSDAEKRAAQSRKDAAAADARASEAERVARDTARRVEQDRGAQTVSFFYEALEPHGEWVEVERLGPCWRPNVTDRTGWRPYTDGQWVFTDYGWTWKSNEPFGWAAYHYGRWARVRRLGWVWQPGTEWGPAWVAWRRSEDYIGWAPLPPEAWSGSGFNAAVDSYYDIGPGSYTFVAAESLGQPTYVGHTIEPERNVTIIQQTTNITNITYKTVQNTTVVYNGGPDVKVVNERATQKVPRLNVERITEVRSPSEAGKAVQRGNVLQLVAPRIAAVAKTAAAPVPAKVRERVKSSEVERGWADIADRAAAQKTRDQMTREARRAEAQPVREKQVSERVAESVTPAPARVVAPPRSAPPQRADRPSTSPTTAGSVPKAKAASGDSPVASPPAEKPPRAMGSPEPAASTPAPGKLAAEADATPRKQRRRPTADTEASAPAAPKRVAPVPREAAPGGAATPLPTTAATIDGTPPPSQPAVPPSPAPSKNRAEPLAAPPREPRPDHAVPPPASALPSEATPAPEATVAESPATPPADAPRRRERGQGGAASAAPSIPIAPPEAATPFPETGDGEANGRRGREGQRRKNPDNVTPAAGTPAPPLRK